MNVAVDAMGGDYAPGVIVEGAAQAASELGIDITLVGDEKILTKELDLHSCSGNIVVHHCEEAVQMDESPLKAVRKKKGASIRVAFDLLKNGDVDAVVSAGNSGASLASGILTLGRVEGVERPAIAGILPGEKGPVVLIDAGANVDCRPAHLLQFGLMAHAFVSSCLNVQNPKVGLLSVGAEDSKGNDQVRLSHELLKQSKLNFVGNVEGRDIFEGKVDIVVCDGFVGNVVLKLSEGIVQVMSRLLKAELMNSFFGRARYFLARRPLKKLKARFDHEEYGGAPLLGINGVGIICHGGSSPRAIKNAIEQASLYVRSRMIEKMVQVLNTMNAEEEVYGRNRY